MYLEIMIVTTQVSICPVFLKQRLQTFYKTISGTMLSYRVDREMASCEKVVCPEERMWKSWKSLSLMT